MKKLLLAILACLVFSTISVMATLAQDVTECHEVFSDPLPNVSSSCSKYYTADGDYVEAYEVDLKVQAFSYSGLSDNDYFLQATVSNPDLPSFNASINSTEISGGYDHTKVVKETVTYYDHVPTSEIGDFHVYTSYFVYNNPPEYVETKANLNVWWNLCVCIEPPPFN